MNIFGVGGAEIVVILLIMLVVAGPKRMIQWAYVVGVYAGKLRKMWAEVVDVLQEEADEAGLNITIPKDIPTRQNITKLVSGMAQPYTEELEQTFEKVKQPLADSMSETEDVIKETKKGAELPSSKKQTPVEPEALDSKSDIKADSPETNTQDTGNYGAWSNPQHPSTQVGEIADR